MLYKILMFLNNDEDELAIRSPQDNIEPLPQINNEQTHQKNSSKVQKDRVLNLSLFSRPIKEVQVDESLEKIKPKQIQKKTNKIVKKLEKDLFD